MPMCYTCTMCGRCEHKRKFIPDSDACYKCGHKNDEGAKICEACGAHLPPKAGTPLGDFKMI